MHKYNFNEVSPTLTARALKINIYFNYATSTSFQK